MGYYTTYPNPNNLVQVAPGETYGYMRTHPGHCDRYMTVINEKWRF